MHILFLTDNFPPESNAPASRTYEHCREWVKAGHRVTVITCVPNFPKGKVFSGYHNRLHQQEMMDGIRVIRVWSYITANEGFVKRILDYVSYMIMSTLAAPFVRGVDIVVGTSPQFFTVCAAFLVSRLKRIPFVFELRDIWPESIKAVGAMKDSKLIRMLEWIEMFLYRRAAKIVTVTHAFKEILTVRGIDNSKIEVVTNGVDLNHFAPQAKDATLLKQLDLHNMFVAGYIGTHGMAHALQTLLEAAKILQQYPNAENVRFIFLGDGACKKDLVLQAKAMELDNVQFLDAVSKEQVTRYWSVLDVALIHLQRTSLFSSVIPSKMFECMSMGLPILHGVAGESAEIVKSEQVGEIFESENAQQLVERLMNMRDKQDVYAQYQRNGLAAAKRYDRKYLALQMLNILENLVKK